MLESRFPSFYRFFNADTCTNELKFPPHVQLALPKSVNIQDRYGNIWPVFVRKVGGDWYFLDGWETFVNENSLKKFDLLRFQYTNDGLFDVKIYGLNGCDKEGVGFKKPGEGAPNSRDDTGEQPKQCKRLDWLGGDLFDDGSVRRPEGRYCVTKFNRNRLNEWHVPQGLLADRRFALPSKLKLHDPEGRTFITRYRQWKDVRTRYVGGWNKLRRLNGLTPDDICICEFDHMFHPRNVYVRFVLKKNNEF